jgi:hypothetical protein
MLWTRLLPDAAVALRILKRDLPGVICFDGKTIPDVIRRPSAKILVILRAPCAPARLGCSIKCSALGEEMLRRTIPKAQRCLA